MVRAYCTYCGEPTSKSRGKKEDSDDDFCNMECKNAYLDMIRKMTKLAVVEAIDSGYHVASQIARQIDYSTSYVRSLCQQMAEEGVLEETQPKQACMYHLTEGYYET